jgi:signal transduction histidine kinase
MKIDNITGFATESILAVPLHAKNRLIGVLEVINKEDKTVFTEKDTMLLSIYATHAAVAIENARLYGELKKQLDEQKKMEKYFADVEKFRALGQISAEVTHDFNNLLGVIMGNAETALYSFENKEKLKNSIEQVLKASDRAKNLVNQIQTFSLQTGQIKIPVQIEQVLAEVLKLLKATMPASIEIRQEIGPNAGTMLADPTQIHQILMNLLTNAQHAIGDKGGMIRLVLSGFELSENNVASWPELRPGSYVKLSISDDGCGLDAETLGKIFEPYFTTKEKGVGTGMGLAVVHYIIHNLGGAIRVYSEPFQGSTFELFLPTVDVNIETKTEKSDAVPIGG